LPRINTREAADFIAALQPFTSNGAIAGDYDDAGAFVVRSYASAVAVIYPDQARAVLNSAKYSKTTSSHQHAARLGVSRLGFEITDEMDPAAFEIKTGHRARLRGAGGWQ
jgi:hypothetical protein